MSSGDAHAGHGAALAARGERCSTCVTRSLREGSCNRRCHAGWRVDAGPLVTPGSLPAAADVIEFPGWRVAPLRLDHPSLEDRVDLSLSTRTEGDRTVVTV